MEALPIIVIILIIVGLISVISYFVYIYLQDKDKLTAQIMNANNQIANEQSNRLSNIKYVVDQVNSVNSDIATQFSSSNNSIFKSLSADNIAITSNLNIQNQQYSGINKSITGLETSLNNNTNNISKMNSGFGQYITFGASDNSRYNLLNLPSSPPPNMNLMSQVNVLMGMTAQNLNPTGSSNINFCYGPDNKNCSSFPNKDGNTFITAPLSNAAGTGPGAIILNGRTTINNNLQICNNSSPPKCATLSIDSSGNLSVDKPIVPNGNNSNIQK